LKNSISWELTNGKRLQGEIQDAPCILRAPGARDMVAVGLTGGGVLLVDPRAKMAAQHSIAAHSAGLADVDVRGDMLATCGYGTRQGQIISDSYVKVRRVQRDQTS